MIKVDDLDAMCKQVDALGGRTAKGPMTVNDGLRMAVCYDPTGN
jgi:predicted enzyme related to lactoylglutathione lyase